MKDIELSDNILEIYEKIRTNINYILNGRNLNQLSDKELILLKELYIIINTRLKDRVQLKKKQISVTKEKISNIIENMKKNVT